MNPRFLLSAVGLALLVAVHEVKSSGDGLEDEVRELDERVDKIEDVLGLTNNIEKEKKEETENGGISSSSEEEEEDEGEAEYGDKTGGDIAESETTYRSGADTVTLWSEGKVFYSIDTSTLPNACISNISKAMLIIEEKTSVGRARCIVFVEKSTMTRNYVYITKKDGCWSKVGCKSGKQELSLGLGCCSVGIIMHELLHAIGVYHEQSRADRDDKVLIQWGNIRPGREGNFEKQPPGGTDKHKDKYDVESITHYGPHAFSKGDKFKTILLKYPTNFVIGQRRYLSDQDIVGLKRLYKCTASGSGIEGQSAPASVSRLSTSRVSSYKGSSRPSLRPSSGTRPTYIRPSYRG